MANVNQMTRPDLAFSYLYSHLSKFVQYPGMLHLEAVERVLQYVRATRLTIQEYLCSLCYGHCSKGLGPHRTPTEIWEDNASCLVMSENPTNRDLSG
jgi:hypothetical protein